MRAFMVLLVLALLPMTSEGSCRRGRCRSGGCRPVAQAFHAVGSIIASPVTGGCPNGQCGR